MKSFGLALALMLFCNLDPVWAATFELEADHSDNLPSVPGLLSGAAQQQQNAYQGKFYIQWFCVPRWMAGSWYKQGDRTISVTDLRTGMTRPSGQFIDNEMTVSWGHQLDRQGNVWHANILPDERDSTSSGKSVVFKTVQQKAESLQADALTTRTHYLVTESHPVTRQVVDMFQQESLNLYTPQNTDQGIALLNKSSNRVFTYQGRPMRDGILESRFKRVAGFQPVPEAWGISLADSLRDYLNANNLSHLAP
ncbi:MAG: hypothetical protein J0H83_03235 [Candidatus Melainabacteria bacterium]|jgi:hypothetical protein|nr:hypothetical protein [Candidatus Melainabacteria bacterium]MBX9674764.1 hypothetical protein [Candidatus Obscuribacterales bacterium]